MFTVYVLYSEDYDKIYIGYTSNLEQRFLSHNELGTKGWTIKFRPWKIIHTEIFENKKEGSYPSADGRRAPARFKFRQKTDMPCPPATTKSLTINAMSDFSLLFLLKPKLNNLIIK